MSDQNEKRFRTAVKDFATFAAQDVANVFADAPPDVAQHVAVTRIEDAIVAALTHPDSNQHLATPQSSTAKGEASNARLVWRSNKFLREAFMETIRGLKEKLATRTYTLFDKPQQSSAHLCWMLSELERRIDEFPADKTGRWIGYIQGCLACNDLLDVDEERDRTRPLFQQAYKTASSLAATPSPGSEGEPSDTELLKGRGLPEDVRSFIEGVTLHLQKAGEQSRSFFHEAYALYDKYDVEGWHAKNRAALQQSKGDKV